MNTPNIHLLPTLQLTPAGHPTPLTIRSAKLRPLLAYLILHHGRPHNRQQLAALLWPDSPDTAGRRNLREYLYRARQTLDQFAPEQPLLTTDEHTVTLTLPPNCTVDLFTFRQTIQQAAESRITTRKITLLEEARTLYKGELLHDFYDDWAEIEREQTRQQYAHLLTQLANLYEAQKDYDQALTAAQQALAQDPLREEHHRRLMTLHTLNGEPSLALQQYNTLKTHLTQELAISPTAETTQLAEAIASGRFQPPPTSILPAPTTRPHFTQFIGRQAELAQLNLLFEQRTHTPTAAQIDTVIIQGDSGVGKTRLAHHWLTHTAGRATLLEGRSHEFETAIPYRPLLDALQQALPHIPWHTLPAATSYTWLAPLAQLLPDIHTHLPDLPPSPINPDEDLGHIMEGMTQLLLSLARKQPLILFLDDLHWADMTTWRFLTFLSRRTPTTPIFTLCTFSNSEATADARQRLRALTKEPHAQTLPLARLWPSDTAQLATHTLTADIADTTPFAQKLHHMTDGNPFFVTEILRALTESDLPRPYTAASLDQLTLPDAIHTLIQSRLERLGRESRQLLSIAASVRREFSFDFLRDIITHVDEDSILNYLEEWLERGLVIEQAEGYDFSHQQIRTVAYTLLSRPRRRRIHRQIALALEQRTPSAVERIARHYTLSDQPTQAIPSLLTAGQRAVNIRSYQEAQLIGRTLLDLLPHTTDARTLPRQQQLAAAYSFSGQPTQALAVLGDVVTLAEQQGDQPAAGQALLKIAQLHWLRGDVRQARPSAEQALTLLNQRPEHAAVLRLLGRINIAQGRFTQAKPYLQEALTSLNHPNPASQLGRATMLGYLITAHGHLGEEVEVRKIIKEIERLERLVESPAVFAVVRTQIAVALNALDLWAEAEPVARWGLQACNTHNLPVYAFVAKSVLGRVAYFLGREQEAYTLLHQAIAWADAHQYSLFRYMAHLHLAEIAHHLNDQTTLAAEIQTAAHLAHQTDNQWAQEQIAIIQNKPN